MSKLNKVLLRIGHSEYFKSISETDFDLKEENKNSEYLYDRLYDLVGHIIDKAKAAKMREEQFDPNHYLIISWQALKQARNKETIDAVFITLCYNLPNTNMQLSVALMQSTYENSRAANVISDLILKPINKSSTFIDIVRAFRLIKSSDEYKFDSILINLITKFLLSIDFELSEYYFIELEDIIKKELSFYQREEKIVQQSYGHYTRTSLLFPECLYKLLIFSAIGELHCESGLKSELVNFIVNKFIGRSLPIYHLFYILRIIKAYKKIGPILLENGLDPLRSIEQLINSVITTKADKLVDLKDSNLNILDSLEDEFGPMFTRRTQKYQLVTSCDERVKQKLLSRVGTLDEIVTLDDAPLICSQKALQDYNSDIYLRSQNPYRLMQT